MCRRQDHSSQTITDIEVDLADLEATRALGHQLAGVLRRGDLIRLEGDLGAGKSELARALIRARAGAAIEVPSPTFTLAQHYPLGGLAILHADLYRISEPEEILELGLIEALDEGCLLVEWPERADDMLPEHGLGVTLLHREGSRRQARLEAFDPSWRERLDLLFGAS